ncbi:MAG: hypothetical protein VR69_10320 [Peptococcaceae bacterium BRH_c4b]|nr:MAG: hypothetical protein VR69_10320 [Peptococcaceae bacterium BRH_c4b]
MKPVMLKLAGLHSFREAQTVDFEKLGEAGLFGIFGPTGSGKSTVLDAVTLALYGLVERAGGRNQGIVNHAEERVLVEFTFELADPEGIKRYRVERVYKRTGENTVAAANSRLVEYTGGAEIVLAEKSRVTDAVVEILGLSADDFTRAVVLPQGKFAEFLSLKPRDRRQMLQRLFGLQDYGDRFISKLKNRLNLAKIEKENILGEKEGLGEASDQAVTAALEKLGEAREIVRQAGLKKERLGVLHGEMQQVWNWQSELEGVMNALQKQDTRQTEINLIEKKLELGSRAERVAPYLTEEQRDSEAYDKSEADLEYSRSQLDGAVLLAGEAGEKLRAAEALRQSRESLLLEQRSQLIRAEKLEPDCLLLQEQLKIITDEGNSKIGEKKNLAENLEKLTIDKRELEEKLEHIRVQLKNCFVEPDRRRQVANALTALKNYRNAQKEAEHWERITRDKEQELNKAAGLKRAAEGTLLQRKGMLQEALVREKAILEHCPEQGEEINSAVQELERLRSRAENYIRCSREMNDAGAEVLRRRGEYATLALLAREAAGQLALITGQLGEAGKATGRLQAALEEGRNRDMARHLAQSLQQGKPCPVCGSIVHPAPVPGDGVEGLRSLEIELRHARDAEVRWQQEYVRTQRLETAAATKARNAADILGEAEKSLTGKEELAGLAGEKVPRVWAGLQEEDIAAELAAREAVLQQHRRALLEWERESRESKQQLEDKQKVHQAASLELVRAEEMAKGAAHALEESRRRMNTLAGERAVLFAVLDSVRGDMAPHEIEDVQKEIEVRDARSADVDRQREDVESRLAVLLGEIESHAARRNGLLVEISGLREKTEALKQQLAEKESELAAITGGWPATTVKGEVEKKLRDLQQREQEARRADKGAVRERGLREQKLAAATSSLEAARQNLVESREKLCSMLEKTGFADGGQAAAALLDEPIRESMAAEVQNFREQRQNLIRQSSQLENCLQGRKLTPEEWQELQDNFAVSRREYDGGLLELGAVEKEYTRTVANNNRWKVLEARLLELVDLQGRLELLEKLFRGNAFVEYLAEEQLGNVALDASVRLGRITGYRYALEVDSEGGFVMRDDGNGGVKRPVSTLSGGEIFITSLSLALALSAQLQLKGRYPLEFFFLDEGFGTLDPELLETVMTALEQLRQEHLTIGIISHVPELKNRMPRRLVVQPAQLSGDGSRLTFEMA